MTLVTLSVITVGAYLYFNFKSRSSLPVIVPKGATQMMHFQTRKMRDESGLAQPRYIDSLARFIARAPVFKHLEKPSDAGIALYSDVVYFQFQQLHCLALSLNSEQRFSILLDTLKRKGFVGGQIKKDAFNYLKVLGTPWYIAYKYKALVLIKPGVETINHSIHTDSLEDALKVIFSAAGTGLIADTNIQKLYESECQWLAFENGLASGFLFKQGRSKFVSSPEGLDKNSLQNPRFIFDEMQSGLQEIPTEKKENRALNDRGLVYLDAYFEALFNYLKQGNYGY